MITKEVIRFGTFGPIVWDMDTGETRAVDPIRDRDVPVGDDLTPEEEDSIPDDM